MAKTKPKVVVTRRLTGAIETRMAELFDVELNVDDAPFSQDQLGEALQRADVLVPTLTDRIDAKVLANAGKRFKLIANFGAGIDHIDMAAARRLGITVTNTPGVLAEDTADMTLALMLAVARRLVEGERELRGGRWQGWSPTHMLGTRLGGKRLGIIGMGRIGQAVARRARAFNIAIHYHNRRRLPEALENEVEATYWESLDQMLARMDIISVNCPHTPATYHLLSGRRLALMPAHAILINTARGEIVDEAALVRLLAEGALGGAGLDVFEREPEVNPALLKLPNVLALPHMSSATHESREQMGEKVMINIKAFTDGHTPPDRVVEDWV